MQTRKQKKEATKRRVDDLVGQISDAIIAKYEYCIKQGLFPKKSLEAAVLHGENVVALLIKKTPSHKQIYLRAAGIVEQRFIDATEQTKKASKEMP